MRWLSALLLAVSCNAADLILHNGRIVTVDSQFRVVEALAVKGDRVLAVGSNKEVLQHRLPATEVIDLAGRMVLPGLIDSHVHALGAGLSEYTRSLPRLQSYEDVRTWLVKQAAVTPKGEWIVVPRTFPTRLREMRMPTKELLDVLREHPVMFDASYVVVANSFALKISGIDRNTPNPPGGEIVKGPDGEPNGILKNAAGLLKRESRSDVWSEADRLRALEQMLQRYAAAGLTSVIDRSSTENEMALFDKLRAREGKLPVRVALTWRPDASGPIDRIVDRIRNGPKPGGDEWLRRSVYKVTLDGGMTIGTAWQRAPYGPFGVQLYGKTDSQDRGQLFVPRDKLAQIFRAAHEAGWSLTAHAQGGGAIDTLLDAFGAVDRERPLAQSRSHLMHASFQSPEALKRAAKLGILADVQAAWLYHDGPALTRVFGSEGMRYFFPLRSYLNAGVRIAGGSDHMIGHDKDNAINPYNPFGGMWTSVTRKTSAGAVLNPEERISREEALRSYTISAAHLTKEENAKGSLEPGKLADLVLIDRDYLRCPEDDIRSIRPLSVWIGGKRVYSATASAERRPRPQPARAATRPE